MQKAISIIHISVYLASLLSCALCAKSSKCPKIMKLFYIYPLLAFLITCNTYFLQYSSHYRLLFPKNFNTVILNLSFLLHYYILGRFINSNLHSPLNKLSKSIFFPGVLVVILILFSYSGFYERSGIAYGITNLSLVILCIIYFYKLFENTTNTNLLRDPGFWVINGIFFGMTATIPINFSGNYFSQVASVEIIILLKRIGLLGYMTMHLFFIKASLCIIQPYKAS